jgi:hypothetical protein
MSWGHKHYVADLVDGGIGLWRGEIDTERHAGQHEGILEWDQR